MKKIENPERHEFLFLRKKNHRSVMAIVLVVGLGLAMGYVLRGESIAGPDAGTKLPPPPKIPNAPEPSAPKCPTGKTMCLVGGKLACVDRMTDMNHCGACNTPCSDRGGKTCIKGQCMCPVGKSECSGVCVDLNTNANCGQCGRRCPANAPCTNGACRCTCDIPGWTCTLIPEGHLSIGTPQHPNTSCVYPGCCQMWGGGQVGCNQRGCCTYSINEPCP